MQCSCSAARRDSYSRSTVARFPPLFRRAHHGEGTNQTGTYGPPRIRNPTRALARQRSGVRIPSAPLPSKRITLESSLEALATDGRCAPLEMLGAREPGSEATSVASRSTRISRSTRVSRSAPTGSPSAGFEQSRDARTERAAARTDIVRWCARPRSKRSVPLPPTPATGRSRSTPPEGRMTPNTPLPYQSSASDGLITNCRRASGVTARGKRSTRPPAVAAS